jgi:hypothetical protein
MSVGMRTLTEHVKPYTMTIDIHRVVLRVYTVSYSRLCVVGYTFPRIRAYVRSPITKQKSKTKVVDHPMRTRHHAFIDSDNNH